MSTFPNSAAFRRSTLLAFLVCVFIVPDRATASEVALAQTLVANTWSWARGNTKDGFVWRAILTFHQDGTVTNPTDHHTWYWWVIDDQTVHLQFFPQDAHPALNLKAGLNLVFEPGLTTYRSVEMDGRSSPTATGARKTPTGEFISESKIPFARPNDGASPSTPAGANKAKSMIEAVSKLEPQAVALATMPLDRTAPASMQEMLTAIDEALKDEAVKTPQASPLAYALARRMFSICRSILNERIATTKRAELLNAGGFTASWVSAWADRVDAYRNTLSPLYVQFREAVRNSPPPKLPVEGEGVAFLDFPPVPQPAAAPPQHAAAPNSAPAGNGGLNRGAYDHRYIWTWGPSIYR